MPSLKKKSYGGFCYRHQYCEKTPNRSFGCVFTRCEEAWLIWQVFWQHSSTAKGPPQIISSLFFCFRSSCLQVLGQDSAHMSVPFSFARSLRCLVKPWGCTRPTISLDCTTLPARRAKNKRKKQVHAPNKTEVCRENGFLFEFFNKGSYPLS